MIVGISVLVWSLATGGSGLAAIVGGFVLMMITRAVVGIGEAGYGPAAPTLISDLYPVERRGAVLSWFYMAIPVGSALGYIVGMGIAQYFHWQAAFYAVVIPGLVLGVWALFMSDPPRGQADFADHHAAPQDAQTSTTIWFFFAPPSYVIDSLGNGRDDFRDRRHLSYWMPRYLVEIRHAGNKGHIGLLFGGITVVAGLISTLTGGLVGDLVRKWTPSSYFLVSGLGILIARPVHSC